MVKRASTSGSGVNLKKLKKGGVSVHDKLDELRDLAGNHLPFAFLELALLLFLCPGIPCAGADCDAVEYFAGQMSWTRGMADLGYQVLAFEHKLHITMDFLTERGFLMAYLMASRVKNNGIAWFAPVCSSWTYMSRGSTQRSLHNPLGDTAVSSVAQGNCMAARCCLLIMYFTAHKIEWVLEQPASTLFHLHPRFQRLLQLPFMKVYKVWLWMGLYGGSTPKGTVLFSSAAWVHELSARKMSKSERDKFAASDALVTKYRDATGQLRCTGNVRLKQSQAYPVEFGRCFAELFQRQRHLGQVCVL